LEAFAAEHRTTLRWAEGNRGFLSALRASRLGFRSLEVTLARALNTFGFAVLAPLGLILEALVGKEHLFAGGEDKLLTAFPTLQDLIVVFHLLLRCPALVAVHVASSSGPDGGDRMGTYVNPDPARPKLLWKTLG
jgi:hypothetical protein